MVERTCSIDGCTGPLFARGWCSKHYTTWRRTGDPLAPKQRIRRQKHIGFHEWVWSFIDKSAGPDACWPWTSPTIDNFGYGEVTYETKRRTKAHRAVWIIVNGPIPEGLEVRHYVCDNPPCCNPAHLKLGTQADNMADMWGKGRGVTRPPTALTETIVREARARKAAGESVRQIAVQLNVNYGTLRDAVVGATWKHIDTPTQAGRILGEASNSAKLTEANVRDIRTRRAAGEKIAAMADEYGVAQSTISDIVHRRKWKHVE